MESSPFLIGLNQHGYAFQYRGLQEALSPPAGRRGPWCRLRIEVPVPGARIVFVLESPLPTHTIKNGDHRFPSELRVALTARPTMTTRREGRS